MHTKGLNTVIDNSEIDYNPAKGVEYLSEALDVQISDVGKIQRRPGYMKKAAGDFQGSFNYLNLSLVVSGDSLYRVNPDYSTTLVKSGLTGDLYDFVGVNEEVYYVNGKEIGIVDKDGEWKSWSFTQYVGPVANKKFGQPPIGHMITYHNARMYVAVENAVFYSEPFFYSAFDYARGYIPFSSRIRLLEAIPEGLFVGTEKEIFFLKGTVPQEFDIARVADYPALINLSSNNMIDGSDLLRGKGYAGPCVIIPTTKGICIGGRSEIGYFNNISMDRIEYPSTLYCSVLAEKERILILINE
jgi:hypothetical protein